MDTHFMAPWNCWLFCLHARWPTCMFWSSQPPWLHKPIRNNQPFCFSVFSGKARPTLTVLAVFYSAGHGFFWMRLSFVVFQEYSPTSLAAISQPYSLFLVPLTMSQSWARGPFSALVAESHDANMAYSLIYQQIPVTVPSPASHL